MPKAPPPDRPSLELDDYSGEFVPDLHLSDFSKEGLMKLVEVGGSIYGDVNRQWYRRVAERFGQEAADELHHDVWFAEGGAGDHENHVISTLMRFTDQNDVVCESHGEGDWPVADEGDVSGYYITCDTTLVGDDGESNDTEAFEWVVHDDEVIAVRSNR